MQPEICQLSQTHARGKLAAILWVESNSFGAEPSYFVALKKYLDQTA